MGARQPRFLSGLVSELAAQPFRVTFDTTTTAITGGRPAVVVPPPPLTSWDQQIVSKQPDLGGLDIRFFEEEGMRQQRRVIYHDFRDEWGVSKLKSGPNDGVCDHCVFIVCLLFSLVCRVYDFTFWLDRQKDSHLPLVPMSFFDFFRARRRLGLLLRL